jgi:hypothetical protein
VGTFLDLGLPTASFILVDVFCSVALFAYLQLLMMKLGTIFTFTAFDRFILLGRENTMQIFSEIEFQTSIMTSQAPINQSLIRLFPERYRYLFPVALLACIYQYIILKPILMTLLCSVEFVASLSCMSLFSLLSLSIAHC